MLYHFIIEHHYRVAGIITDLGWGNGYVLLPKEHPFYGKKELQLWVHGGITLSSKYSEFNIIKRNKGDFRLSKDLEDRINKEGYNFLDDYWCIGFDTAHSGDDIETCPKEYVWNETQELLKKCLDDSNKDIRKWKLNQSRKLKLKNIDER